MRSTDGLLTLLDRWLVDAALYPPAGEAPFSLDLITVQESVAAITLVDRDGLLIGLATCGRSDTRPIAIYSPDGQLVGQLVPGPDANHTIFAAGDGQYRFGPGRADLVASVVMDLSAFGGFTSFSVDDQTVQTNDLVLVGEYGVQLTVEDTTAVQPDGSVTPVIRVRLHAVGDPQYLTRVCEDNSRRPLRFVREVVFQYGDFTHVCHPQNGGVLMLAGSPSSSETALQVQSLADRINVRLRGKAL